MLLYNLRTALFTYICVFALTNLYNYKFIFPRYNFDSSPGTFINGLRSKIQRNKPKRIIFLKSDHSFHGKRGRAVESMFNGEDGGKVHDARSIVHVPLDESKINPKDVTNWKGRATDYQTYEKYGNSTSEKCIPMASWHGRSFPTCNTMHEADLHKDILRKKANGFYRDMWLFLYKGGNAEKYALGKKKYWGEIYALKTLRITTPFTEYRYDQHRLDALITERLTFSNNSIKIYGWCGHSVINSLESTDGLFAMTHKDFSSFQKLQFSRDAAVALSDLHSIDHEKSSVIHRDIRGSNFLLSKDKSRLLIHDFNLSRLRRWNTESSSPCGVLKSECTPYRSPEECLGRPLTEKIDVYSLGNVLYLILMGIEPYFYPKRLGGPTIHKMIAKGIRPKLSSSLTRSTDPAIVAIRRAMEKCYTYDPGDRPSASEIARELEMTIKTIEIAAKI